MKKIKYIINNNNNNEMEIKNFIFNSLFEEKVINMMIISIFWNEKCNLEMKF